MECSLERRPLDAHFRGQEDLHGSTRPEKEDEDGSFQTSEKVKKRRKWRFGILEDEETDEVPGRFVQPGVGGNRTVC